MNKIVTIGKRYLKGDVWHDDRGEIPGSPALWDPPMTEDEVYEAALSDPDGQPSTPEQLARMRRIPLAKFTRQKLGMSCETFSDTYAIPLDTLIAWERHEAEPTPAETSFLKAIAAAPEAVRQALAKEHA